MNPFFWPRYFARLGLIALGGMIALQRRYVMAQYRRDLKEAKRLSEWTQ